MWKTLSIGLLLVRAASADTQWTQVPGRPVWLALPSTWSVAGDPDRSAFTATNPRGGVLTVVVAPAAGADPAAAREWDLLSSGYRGVEAPRIDAKGLHGIGRIGEATFALDVVERALDVSKLTAVEPSVLIVASAIPESVAKELARVLPEVMGSVRVQWERPGGGWTTVPGTAVQLREPDAGYRTRVASQTVYVGAVDGSVEVQASLERGATDVAPLLERLKGGLAPDGFAWTQAPFVVKGIAAKGGLVVSGGGIVDGKRYELQIVGLPLTEGVLVVIRTAARAESAGGAGAAPIPEIGKSLRPAR